VISEWGYLAILDVAASSTTAMQPAGEQVYSGVQLSRLLSRFNWRHRRPPACSVALLESPTPDEDWRIPVTAARRS
jgi:hypothetical protein